MTVKVSKKIMTKKNEIDEEVTGDVVVEEYNHTSLTPHFTLEEFTKTSTEYDNTPGNVELINLKKLAKVMEVLRSILGDKPVIVNSAFRNTTVNRAVGGSSTSDHCKGLAIDFNVKGMSAYDVCKIIADCPAIKFSQLILEYRGNRKEGTLVEWVHFSIASEKREILTIVNDSKLRGLKKQ